MLLKKLAPLVALAGFLDVAFCAPNIAQTVTNINAIRDGAQKVYDAMSAYNGGVKETISVGTSVQGSETATRRATKDLNADSEQFSDADAETSLAALEEMTPAVVAALDMAAQKAPALREAGVGGLANGMVNRLYDAKNDFEQAYISKLPKDGKRMVSPHDEEVDAAFRKAMTAMSS